MSEGFNSMAQRAETAERKLAVLKRRIIALELAGCA